MSDLQSLHHKYRWEMRPIMEMLKHKQSELKTADWIRLVRQTEQKVIESPDQYLTRLPQKEILDSLVHSLFNEFIEETS